MVLRSWVDTMGVRGLSGGMDLSTWIFSSF